MYYIVSFIDQKFCLQEGDGSLSLSFIQRSITSKLFNLDILGSWKTAKDEPIDARLPISTLKDLGLTSLKFEDSKTFTIFLDLYDDIVKPFSTVKLDDSEEDSSPEALRIKYMHVIRGKESTFCSNFSSYLHKGKQRYGPKKTLFQEITGYGKSYGKFSWVSVFVIVSDRMNDIENHLYHDIRSGYVRIVTSKSNGKLVSCN